MYTSAFTAYVVMIVREADAIQFLTLAQNIGLLFGAVFWGFGCDIFGRRWACM
jgi:MFS family permease